MAVKFLHTVWSKPVVLTAACCLLIGWASWIGWLSTQNSHPTSPDEAANQRMAQEWAAEKRLRIPTRLTPEQLSIFHPRSFIVRGNELRPGSFIGFVMLEGWLQRLGYFAPIVVTMIMAVVAVWAWYKIGRRYWEWPWALGASALLATLPVLVAHHLLPYSQPSLYISFLLLTSLTLLRYQERPTLMRAIIVGLLYGVALFIRPVEVLFTGPVIAIIMLAHRRFVFFLATILTVIIIQIPWLYVASQTFGAALSSGYTSDGLNSPSPGSGTPLWITLLQPVGGGWSWNFLSSARDYLLLLYPVLSAMSLIALVMYFRRKFISSVKILKIGGVILFGLYYLAYYGSWELYPDAPVSRIGSAASYARYWLPLYVAMTAGVVVFLRRNLSHRPAWAGIIITGLMSMQIWTWWMHPSGLQQLRRDQTVATQIQTRVLNITEPDSLVIAGHNEKLFVKSRLTSFTYPSRASDWSVLATIVAQRPVYVLGIDMPIRPSALQSAAAAAQLELLPVATINRQPIWRIAPITRSL